MNLYSFFREYNIYLKTYKLAKGNLSSSQLFVTSLHIDYGLFTNLPGIVKFADFSASSFKLKRGILPPLTKYVS